ncbi:hypothetical protein DFAR_2960005 [Desulfarculales bacterium]
MVVVTGLGALDDKISGLKARADDFLFRPVNTAELLTRSLWRSPITAWPRSPPILTPCSGSSPPTINFELDASLRGLMEFLLSPPPAATRSAPGGCCFWGPTRVAT